MKDDVASLPLCRLALSSQTIKKVRSRACKVDASIPFSFPEPALPLSSGTGNEEKNWRGLSKSHHKYTQVMLNGVTSYCSFSTCHSLKAKNPELNKLHTGFILFDWVELDDSRQ